MFSDNSTDDEALSVEAMTFGSQYCQKRKKVKSNQNSNQQPSTSSLDYNTEQSEELDYKSTLNNGIRNKVQSVSKINKILQKRGNLSEANLSLVCRRVVDSIEEFSLCPCGNSLRLVVQQMFTTYPSTLINPKDPVASSQAIVGIHSESAGNEDDNLDMASYKINYEKLIKLYKDSGSTGALKSLCKLTFKGRRYEITKGYITSPEDILKTRCPLLNQQHYLYAELDLILGSGTCKNFKKKWEDIVPVVIAVARKFHKNTAVKKILNRYQSSIENKCFESESCAVLELLPVIISANKRSCTAGDYFFDVHEDSSNIASAIKKHKRETPFILKIGDTSYTVIVDSTIPFIESACSTEALLQLISVYYQKNSVDGPSATSTPGKTRRSPPPQHDSCNDRRNNNFGRYVKFSFVSPIDSPVTGRTAHFVDAWARV
ncbi:hypothetical protein OUZ56_011995 [Daphnia magna]|uniref:Uncharacterized protein n=1 Tax=Daphnia magna TaxID=35525 RepID=A0ABQ9Z1R7_9CRUS|nr:hypothetical protein OUZ56_011995 [Daphnia magna]